MATVMDLSALPATYRSVIPESYLDEMGHMNVMWYAHLFSRATEGIFGLVGLTREYFESNPVGTFALEQHIRYLAEVRAGQHVTVRTRLIGRSAKVFHFIHFLANDTTSALSATGESIGVHIDMRVRRSTPLPPEVTAIFDRVLAEHQALEWAPPLCGVMKC
jgi:acyl-CoA thioester hydrolase